MALDTAEKRQNITCVGRPFMRSHFPQATPDEEWRAAAANSYGAYISGGAGPVVGEWEMIPPWLKRRRIATEYI